MTLAPEQDRSVIAGSVGRFGYEWHHYAEMRPEYEEQFRRWTVHLAPEDWRAVSFLDVGCGMGRNSYWPMRYGAAEGVAIDMDDRSLASARRTLAGFPGCGLKRPAPTPSLIEICLIWCSRSAWFITWSIPSRR